MWVYLNAPVDKVHTPCRQKLNCQLWSTILYWISEGDDIPTSSQEAPMSNRSPTVEPSIVDPPISDVVVNHAPVTYKIVEEGTKRRKINLVDSVGFSYNVHSKRSYATYWQCTVRPKGNPCKASVIQRNGEYQAGKSAHNHPTEAGAFIAAKVVAAVKKKALVHGLFNLSFVFKILLNDLENDRPCAALPKPQHIARAANRLRQKLQPQDPKDLQFDLQEECIPEGFLQADMKVKERRHLVFVKNEQLRILCQAKSWYVDGTFKLVRHPFKQLLTINAFVRSGDHARQVPLVYVVMSGRNTKDYKKVSFTT